MSVFDEIEAKVRARFGASAETSKVARVTLEMIGSMDEGLDTLAQKFRDGKLVCVEGFEVASPKTNAFEAALAQGLGVEKKALLVPLDDERNLGLAARNNPRLRVVRALGLSIVDVLDHDTVIVSEPALRRLAEVLA